MLVTLARDTGAEGDGALTERDLPAHQLDMGLYHAACNVCNSV